MRQSQLEECRERCVSLREQIQAAIHQDTIALKRQAEEAGFEEEKINFRSIRTLQGHYGKVFDVAWFKSPNDTDLVSVSQDGKVLVWDVMTSNKKVAIPLRSTWILTCAVSPTGKLIACGGLDDICTVYQIGDIVGWETAQAHRELQQHEGYISKCRFVNDNQIVSSSGDSTCVLWDIPNRMALHTFTDHTGDVMSVSVIEETGVFVSGSVDASAKVWDPRSGQKCVADFQHIHTSDINDVQWFPNNNAFVTGSDDSFCKLFDVRSRRQLNEYPGETNGGVCGITSVDFSNQGHYLIAAYDDQPFCRVWGTATGKFLQELSHDQRVAAVMVSETGFAIATGCWDKQIRIWA